HELGEPGGRHEAEHPAKTVPEQEAVVVADELAQIVDMVLYAWYGVGRLQRASVATTVVGHGLPAGGCPASEAVLQFPKAAPGVHRPVDQDEPVCCRDGVPLAHV